MKPVVFMDIDGVLNVFPRRHGNPDKLPHRKVWNRWEVFTYTVKNPDYISSKSILHSLPKANNKEYIDYVITYSPDLIERLNKLTEKVDIVWLTTWRNLAVEVFAPRVGLEGAFPVADADGSDSHHGTQVTMSTRHKRWWKINAVLDYLEENPVPFVIFDDLLFSATKRYIRGAVEYKNLPSLMFTTYDSKGIEPYMLDKVEEFVSSL